VERQQVVQDSDPKKVKDDKIKKAKVKKLRRTPMPKQLLGGVPCDDEGNPFCFAFNLGTCKSGDDCKKGLHLCCKRGCKKKHAFVKEHKAS